ncbi:MAG: tetratricopeptide repeat protein [Chitinispirillaceae bacterium]|nr:tetratricopeptide repeat protein [Chitinispirillaceae bacterium]
MDEWLDLGDLIDKSEEFIELGLYDEATKLLNRYSRLYSDAWEICVLYGRICTDLNKPVEAISWLRKGLRLDRTSTDCLLGLFYAYAMLHQVKRGGKYLLRAEKYHPDNEIVLTALIWYYTELHSLPLAISYFEKLQHNGVSNPETFRNGAIAYQRSGLYDNAEHCFKIALELNPQYDEVLDMLADLYVFLEQEEKAIQLYQDVLRDSPRNVRILSRLVFCHTQANHLEKAASLAKESIRLYPNSPIGYVDLAYVHLNDNRPQQAIECADRAHDISPLDAEAFRIKGIAYSDLGEWEKGKGAFKTAIDIDPENTEIMRDYYHHLRNAGDTVAMEAVVHEVIRIEQPYCVEDYWFLADYYRENGRDLEAFHFLKKAYKSMPGEKELIPPMVDILLERGHTGYSLPFLLRYIGQGGWNDTMNDFARHSRFRGKWSQEGIRFLRFHGQRPKEYRKYIFSRYLELFLLLSVSGIVAAALVPVYFLSGMKAVVMTGVAYAFLLLIYRLVRFVVHRRRALPVHVSSF